jgi:phosphoinositide 3-/4-kinase-like protein
MELKPVGRIHSRRASRLSPKVEQKMPAVASDGYSGSVTSSAEISLPKLDEPEARQLSRGYLWQAIPLPGPIDHILQAAVGVGPIPKWLGLEPAPKGRPNPELLPFSWNQSTPDTFAKHCDALEHKLRDPNATEIGKRKLRAGSNSNYLVTLSNGVTALWTPKAGEKEPPRPNIPKGTQAGREEAAYLVDRRLGHWARVPPAVSSGLEGRPGSLKLLVSQPLEKEHNQAFSGQDRRRMAIFDNVIGNLDRHSENFLVDQEKRPIPVDHGLAFPTKNGPQGKINFNFKDVFQLNDIEKGLLNKLKKERPQVTTELEGLLEPEAIDAMYARVDRMLELGWVSHEWMQ